VNRILENSALKSLDNSRNKRKEGKERNKEQQLGDINYTSD